MLAGHAKRHGSAVAGSYRGRRESAKAGAAVISEHRFRHVLGHFATGVAVVAGADPEGEYAGLTVNSITAVSLDPPLVLVCVAQASLSREVFLASSAFAISILGRRDLRLARRFAGDLRDSRFSDVAVRIAETGAPILEGCLAWLDCALWKSVEAGDHTVLFGEVRSCGVSGEGSDPLVFFRGGYGTVAP